MMKAGTRAIAVVVGAIIGATSAAAAGATTFSNSAPITINDAAVGSVASATPYPSTITVSGLAGTVLDLNVHLFGFTHTFTHDVDVLLVGNGGAKKIVLMADSGQTATNVDLAFDDGAASSLPLTTLVSGTYKPTIQLPGSCPYPNPFPQPAPLGPYGTALSDFNGTTPNGVWYLYVVDDCNTNSGAIAGGWSLDFTMSQTAVTLAGTSALKTRAGVVIRWKTGTEADLLGFQVYRVRNHAERRLTHSLIRAKGGVTGASYRFVDRTAGQGAGALYRIKAVNRDGTVSWFGPLRVT